MRSWTATGLLAAGLLVGCMANGPVTTAQVPRPAPPPAAGGSAATLLPLVLDRNDLRMGTTVQYARVPEADEVSDLQHVPGLAHVVLTLEEWPESYEALPALDLLPPESDVIVVLRGYPPSRAAADAWNQVRARLRVVLLVAGPPPSLTVIEDLNAMRALDRVIAELDPPARTGFERLQRPLSFLQVRD
jgi:hypothetical protein